MTAGYTEFRIRLAAPKALTLPSSAYDGPFYATQVRALPASGKWLRKKTRGLLVFYFTSPEAILESRLRKKRARAQRDGADDLPPPAHVYIPLEPGGMLWMTLPVPPETTAQQAVTDALWRPISADAIEILKWYACFLDDMDLPLNLTTAEPTQRFVRDYNGADTMGNLIEYTGMLHNDGSTHPLRKPEHSFPCLI